MTMNCEVDTETNFAKLDIDTEAKTDFNIAVEKKLKMFAM